MAEKRENSVLFSLRELRTIEEERIQEEQSAVRQAEEDRVRQQMDAERQAREAAEAKRMAQEEAEREARERAERMAREERLSLEAAERQARVEAQAALERERLAREMEIAAMRASNKKPFIIIATVVCLVAGGIGFWAYNRAATADQEAKLAVAEKERIQAETKKRQAEIDGLVEDIKTEAMGLANANSEEEREQRRKALAQKEKELRAKKQALRELEITKAKRAAERKEQKRQNKAKCDPNDPLCGI